MPASRLADAARDQGRKCRYSRLESTMKMFIDKTGLAILLAATIAASFSASADTPVSQVRGTVGDVPFPDKERSYLAKRNFVSVENLRQMGPGLSKDQVRLLLGNPHFNEGLFGVDKWNYILNFHTGNDDDYITCQYQVRYGKQDVGYRAESLHWDGPACMELANRDQRTPGGEVQRFELSADALFAFDRAGEGDILPGGREAVADIAAKLKEAQAASVQIIGHTDEMGSESYNQGLSQRRALAVRKLLIDGGVPASTASALGAGESQPVKRCDAAQPSAVRKACLQPNRRVEIVASGSR